MVIAALLSGAVIGLVLGLVGGGGSILAVPLLVYVVGVKSPHAAIGTSLVAVTAFGATTATSYALSGFVDWVLVGELIAGGLAGSLLGIALGKRLAGHRRTMELGFAAMVILIGGYVTARGLL